MGKNHQPISDRDGASHAMKMDYGLPTIAIRRAFEQYRRHDMTGQTRLLYVDDEPALRTLVKHQLDGEGFLVETADDGDTAIDKLKQDNYKVILLDIRMPRVSGIEVLKYIRERKISSRVIVLTAVDDLSVAIEAVKNGANDYITKPYDFNNLLTAIRRVMAS